MKVNYYKHPITGKIIEMEEGFNFLVFLFGWIYLFFKGDFETGALLLISSMIFMFLGLFGMIGILGAHLYIGFKWNKQYTGYLIERGYESIN